MFSQLAHTPIFKGLESEEIEILLEQINYRMNSYGPEDVIANANEKSNKLFILLEGHVRGEMTSYNDKNIVINEIRAPDTFAEGFLFANRNKLLVNIIANTKAKLLIISKGELLKLLSKSPGILSNYLNVTSNRFVGIASKLKFLMFNTVREKLANYILDLEKENGSNESFRLGKTHEELAAFFAITRPALTRNLLKLKNDGLIEIQHKKVRILDREGLIKLLS